MSTNNMICCYLRWRDASHGLHECSVADMGLSELQEIGWLVQEDEEKVTLSMEHEDESSERRLWLSVPKGNIVERRDIEFEKAFPVKRKRRSDNKKGL
jgi:hypothetical protein